MVCRQAIAMPLPTNEMIPSVEHIPCVRDQPRCLQRENPSGVHMSKTIDEKAVKLPPLK